MGCTYRRPPARHCGVRLACTSRSSWLLAFGRRRELCRCAWAWGQRGRVYGVPVMARSSMATAVRYAAFAAVLVLFGVFLVWPVWTVMSSVLGLSTTVV